MLPQNTITKNADLFGLVMLTMAMTTAPQRVRHSHKLTSILNFCAAMIHLGTVQKQVIWALLKST